MRIILGELSRLQTLDPTLVPAGLSPGEWHSGGARRDAYFDRAAVRSFLAAVIGRIEAALDSPDTGPVTEHRVFPFVSDGQLRRIVERDYEELQRAYIAGCWKSTIILSGGAIETVLLDLVRNNPRATAAESAPKGKPELSRWDLNDLIKVAVELKLVSSTVEKLSHSVRDYRNLVHPGNELRSGLRFDREEARIAIEVLNALHRDLS